MTPSLPYAEALARIPGPDWLADRRRLALAQFLESGLPDSRDEDWRQSDLGPAAARPLRLPGDGVPSDKVLAIEDYPGALMAYADDRLIWQDTRMPASQLGDLADAEGAGRYRLGTLCQEGALARLNLALWRAGTCLHVPAGQRPRQPVFLRFAAASADILLQPRLLVVLEPHADAILVEHFSAEGGLAHWQNAVTEVFLEPGARLTHIRLVEGGTGGTHTHLVAVQQARDSQYRSLNLALGGDLVRLDVQVTLADQGAVARLDGLFAVDGRRRADHRLGIDHAASHTTSRTTWRGLADARGRGGFVGRLRVRHGTEGTDARQDSRNLLLSPWAEIDTRPQLEIYSDAVQCGHGATVGCLDPDALFYLTSRAIDPDRARTMLLMAFAEQALGLADDAGLGEWLRPRLAACLPRNPAEEAS